MDLLTPQIIQQGSNYHVQHGTDAGLFVQFYMEAVQDDEASTKAGRPIFREVEFIKIIPVGDKNTVVCRPVKKTFDGGMPPDSERWPRQYSAFKNQQEQPLNGTPITEWPVITKAQAMTLKASNVHTLEALAAVADTNLDNLGMGSRELRDKAIAFINQAENGSGLVKLQEENKALKIEVEALKNQLNALSQVKAKKAEAVDDQKVLKDGKDAS